MDQTPYAQYPRPGQGGVTPGSRPPGVYFEAIGEAWNLVLKDLGHWVAATIVYFVIVYALSIPIMLVTRTLIPTRPSVEQLFGSLAIQMVLNVIPTAISSVLIVGMVSMGVRKSRGEYINVGMMFEPFRRFGSVVGACFLYWVVTFAAMVALFLPFLYFAPILILLPVVAYQKEIGPIEALTLTYDRCKTHWLSLLGLCVLLWIVSLAGFFACCVGIFVAYPIVMVTLGIHYRAFFESEAPPVATGY